MLEEGCESNAEPEWCPLKINQQLLLDREWELATRMKNLKKADLSEENDRETKNTPQQKFIPDRNGYEYISQCKGRCIRVGVRKPAQGGQNEAHQVSSDCGGK